MDYLSFISSRVERQQGARKGGISGTSYSWALGLASHDYYARKVGDQRLALRPVSSSASPRPARPLRPGGQVGGNAYPALLDDHEAVRSQSRRGECLDNAQAESLWSRLKTEQLEQCEWPTFRDVADDQHSVATYFDYDNHERRHSALAYQTLQTFYLQQLRNTSLNCLA